MSRPLTVLMTTDAVGGVFSFSISLARMLARSGVRVHLATMGPPPSECQIREAIAIGSLSIHVSDFDLEWMDDPWEDVERAGEWLLELEERFAPDIIHLNGYAHGRFPFSAPIVCVAHSCVCSWWRAVHGEEAPASWDRYRREVRAGLERASIVVAPTAWMLAEIERSYGSLPRKALIPNGVSIDVKRAPEKERFFLASGRIWDRAKNMSLLDRAARALSWPVLAAGSDVGPSGQRAIVESVKLLGPLSRDAMEEWMSRAPVLIHPALYEPFGLVPLEAAAAGAALLLADIPSLREVWGGAALYFPPRDPDRLTQAAKMIADDANVRSELQRRARVRARRYPIERTAARYLELYRELSIERQTGEVQRS